MPVTTTKDYECFDPKVYFHSFHDMPKKDAYFMERLTDFWTNVVKKDALSTLEYGAGPTISRFITACKHVQCIIAAEYLESNRKAMEDWLNKDPKAFNWRPTFEHVIQKLEGMPPEEIDKREAAVREKVKAVIHCDVKAPIPLEIPNEISAEYGPPFDVVASSLTIEAVVETEKEYRDVVAYLTRMVKPGGHLIMHGVLEQTFYTVGKKLYTFYLTKEMILKAMEEAGLKNIVFDCATSRLGFEEFNELPLADLKDIYVVYGQA